MFAFHEEQTQAQIAAAIEAGGFSLVSFAVVAPDPRYPTGSVTVLLLNGAVGAATSGTGYRTATASESAAKTYVASLISTYSLGSMFYTSTVDDGQGIMYTLAETEAW